MPTDEELKQPQRFPLTGDGLVTHRVIADGPFNGRDIGEELALARYRDHQFAQEQLLPQAFSLDHTNALHSASRYAAEVFEDRERQQIQGIETQPTGRRPQMPDPEADRQADAYWEGLINRARQTEQNAQAYAAAPRQAAPEQASQLPIDETPKIVLGR